MNFAQDPVNLQPKRHVRRALPDLPTFYYHTNFCDMLRFVEDRYAHVFAPHQLAFLTDFATLPMPAQCLFVRIAGRKGRIFNQDKLQYAEITSLPRQYAVLRDRGFIAPIMPADMPELFRVLTKPELAALMTEHLSPDAFKRSWKKAELVETAIAHLPTESVRIPDQFFKQGRTDSLRYLTYLYFGKIQNNLQNFTLRDLGLLRVPDFKADYSARFDTRIEAETAYFYARTLHDLKHAPDLEAAALINTIEAWPAPVCDISEISRDALLQKLGGLSERGGDIETALSLYGRSDAPPCNERTIRLRWTRNNSGDRDWTESRLESLIENPASDDEYYFAADFMQRKFHKKRTSQVTDILRAGGTLMIDELYRHEPERAALRHYKAQGYDGYLTENAVWRMLFGLLFWDLLYGDSANLHNSFERMPASLKTNQFYDTHNDAIDARLSNLSKPSELHINILKTASRNHGAPNGIFRWNGRTLDKILALTTSASPESLAAILRLMAQSYRDMKSGFPDLMLLQNGRVKFVEVKAEGDVIRRNQLTCIQQLRAAGFETEIARITWTVDPAQIYVVVDVETTGGPAGPHRVTEIGAVKIQNGKIISEFQTLINPERSIPAHITRLTGITQDMVKDAPTFADIAEDFETFMGEAIFAAHNVNFDYKFISSEFRRTGRRFRHAKICTCASMRKYYPGRKSYSLKNLCQAFDINLKSHHRALCDAKAAAELLFLINEKRQAG